MGRRREGPVSLGPRVPRSGAQCLGSYGRDRHFPRRRLSAFSSATDRPTVSFDNASPPIFERCYRVPRIPIDRLFDATSLYVGASLGLTRDNDPTGIRFRVPAGLWISSRSNDRGHNHVDRGWFSDCAREQPTAPEGEPPLCALG